MKKYHTQYNSDAGQIAKKEEFESWWQGFLFHNTLDDAQQDFDRPRLIPWVPVREDTAANRYYERNPYYWKIDTAGNQLPYIDVQARILVENVEVRDAKAIAGEFDHVAFRLLLDKYTLLKEGEAKGDYHVDLWDAYRCAELSLAFNYTHKDPALRTIFNDIRFRQAMSLAIDRQEMNKVLYFGKGTPMAHTAVPGTSFYEDWMGEYYVEHDPEKANALLDEMGLAWDKNHEWRLRPDGKRLDITLEFWLRPQIVELAIDYWHKVGVNIVTKVVQSSLYIQRGKANERDMGAHVSGRTSELGMYTNAGQFQPPWQWSNGVAYPWFQWHATNGQSGEEPPEEVKKTFDLVERWQATLPGTEEYLKLGKEILTIHTKNIWQISTVGLTPWPVIFKNSLRNIPDTGYWAGEYWTCMPSKPDQWFFKE